MDVKELTTETILNDNIFNELFEIEDTVERERLLQELLDKSKILGVKTKFENIYKAQKAKIRSEIKKVIDFEKAKKEEEKRKLLKEKEDLKQKALLEAQRRNEMKSTAMTNFNSDKYPDLLCGSWQCDETGIKTYGIYGETIACYHPILPVKRLVNLETRKEKMTIAFKKTDEWQEIILEKSTLLSSNKITGVLTDNGVLISSESAKHLVKYFLEVEAMNINLIPTEKSTSKLGWIDNHSEFIPFSDCNISFDGEGGFYDAFNSICEKGNYEKYMSLLKDIRKRNRREPMICVAASLASVLVEPMGVLPFIFHLYGEGGKGKTITSMLAASVWGNPSEDGYLADPKSTMTGFETFLNFLNHMPFICDDISKIKKNFGSLKQDFGEFIYFLCGGVGKRRSNAQLGNDKIKTWKNCSITNAEKPLTNELSNGGEILRCIELETESGIIFDDGTKGKNTADFLRSNYGFIGKRFIKIIKDIGLEEVKKIYDLFMHKINEKDTKKEKEGKQINPIALILTADKILTDYLFKDEIYIDFDFMFNLIRGNNQMSDNERAYNFIMNEVEMNKKKFIISDYEPEQRWGYIYEYKDNPDEYVLINPNAFNGFCDRGNFSKKMFIEWAAKKGWAEKDKDRLTKKIKNEEEKIKGNFIMIKMWQGEGLTKEQIEEMQNEIQMEMQIN